MTALAAIVRVALIGRCVARRQAGEHPSRVACERDYFFWPRPVRTSATPNTAAVTMSCLGARLGAVRAIKDTN